MSAWCGRYKAITISLELLCLALLLLCGATIIGMTKSWSVQHLGLGRSIPFCILLILMFITIVLSLSCYQANIIQLGLDQLLEAPSEKLSQFIHWLMWAYTLGSFIPLITFVFLPCSINSKYLVSEWIRITSFMPFTILLLLSLLLAFTCYNKSWFYFEPGQNDPYKTVYRVLRFAWKNKYPICRSAFTYCDDLCSSMSFHNIVVNIVVNYYHDYTTMYYKLTSKAINMMALRKKQPTLPSTLISI